MADRKRRDRGDGSIYFREDRQRWVAALSLPSGRRVVRHAETRRDALAALRLLQREQERETLVSGRDQLLGDYLEGWLSEHRTQVRPNSHAIYRADVASLKRHLGSIPLRRLTAANITTCYAAMTDDEGKAPATVSHAAGVLRQALARAVERRLLVRNPAEGIRGPRVDRAPITTYTEAQVNQVLTATAGTEYAALWALLVSTGLRIGEALGLRWTDVDTDAKRITISRQMNHGQDAPVKTKASNRTVMLSRTALDALHEHGARQREERMRLAGLWSDRGLIFPNPGGAAGMYERVRYAWIVATASAGLPHIRLHDLRHTAATILLQRGVHPKVVQEMLGHASISMTLDLYSHVTPTMHGLAADAMDAAFGKSRQPLFSADMLPELLPTASGNDGGPQE